MNTNVRLVPRRKSLWKRFLDWLGLSDPELVVPRETPAVFYLADYVSTVTVTTMSQFMDEHPRASPKLAHTIYTLFMEHGAPRITLFSIRDASDIDAIKAGRHSLIVLASKLQSTDLNAAIVRFAERTGGMAFLDIPNSHEHR